MKKVVAMRKMAVSMVALAMMLGLGIGNFEGREASAACGYGVQAGDFFAVCARGESEDGTIKVEPGLDGDTKVTVVTLNNYDGEGVILKGCGSYGPDAEYSIVNLVGDNQIIEEGGIGLHLGKVKFVGEGTLTITAMIPVGGGMLCDYCATESENACQIKWAGVDEEAVKNALGSTTMTIAPAKGVVIETPAKPEVKPEEPEQPEQPEEKPADDESVKEPETKPDSAADNKGDNGLVWHIASGVYIGLSLVAFAVLGVHQVVKRNKAKKSTTVEIKPKTEVNAEPNDEKTD